MSNVSNAFVGAESSEIKKNNRRPALSRIMYSMRDTKVASFDIFDTLLLRPFSDPKDLFYILGEKFDEMDFYNLRIRCEREARDIREEIYGDREITIYDIYKRIQYYTGMDVEFGVKTEFDTEMDLVYPNTYQKYILDTFINNGIPVVLTSDMYYPAEMMKILLKKNGFEGYEKLYISCDRGCSKSDGALFDCISADYADVPIKLVTHIDDNWNAVLKAREKGLHAVHYVKNTGLTNKYSPKYMSAMIGSAYRGITGNYLGYNENRYSVPYEYGFIYGGFLLLGYCSYIHEVCIREKIDKVFFMSRDGDIIKQVWDFMYKDISGEYLLVSRACVMRLSAEIWKKMFIENTVDRMSTRKHKITAGEILEYSGLSALLKKMLQYGLTAETVISQKEEPVATSCFRDFMESHIEDIKKIYKEENIIYMEYLKDMVSETDKRIALVDIGWRGVNGMALSRAIKKVRPLTRAINFMIGGRQPVNLPQIRKGDIRCYLFSAEKNYNALEQHKEKTNFYCELLTMSATSSFEHFYRDDSGRVKISCGSTAPADYAVILEIQRGILDFVREYTFRFKKYPSFFRIPADDVTQVIYNIMGKDEYFVKYFSNLKYSPEMGNDSDYSFGEWI